MGLRLHPVAARRGLWWVRAAFATWARRPLAFIGLFMFFLFGVLLLLMLPLVGPVLGLGLLPMLTLGFMIATRSALHGGPVHAVQIFEGLRGSDVARRKAQLMLCAVYALGSIGVMEFSAWLDGGSFERLQMALATPNVPQTQVNAILADPQLATGMLVRMGLATLLSIPFWHAPALVHWGGQGAFQALFSSSLALWRARGAFVVYGIGWMVVSVAFGLLATLAVLLLGNRQLVSLLAMPAGMVLSAVFYVSLWFSFTDSFVDEDDELNRAPGAAPLNPPA